MISTFYGIMAGGLILLTSSPPPGFPPRAPIARKDRGIWITSADYPSSSVSKGQSGKVSYLLTIGPDGRAKTCRIIQSSGASELDETTCALVRSRGRFIPAINEEGQPTVGFLEGAHEWVLPTP